MIKKVRGWWPGWAGAGIGVGNGVLREATLVRVLDEDDANRLSALTAVAAFTVYFEQLQRRWPLGSGREAVEVGAAWLALTVAFEFGFGRLVAKKSWRELSAEYDVRRGRLWPARKRAVPVRAAVVRKPRRPP